MEIRHSTEKDLNRIMEIYEYARDFMAKHGNPNQWGPTNWPPEELIHSDIAAGCSYVCTHENRIVGTFFFQQGKDIEPTYHTIENGAWLADSAYGVIHRLAGDGTVNGIGYYCIEWAFKQCGHLRVDTHGDNQVMQNLLNKCGFVHCGTIHVVEDDYPRLAYEKIDI
ncbi:MAG: GNAT family N-acetyltransferase [Lachnospiraceae bacterium]|nr:GNAT family N-acetyltransferase [Lachnospiraceae bacterium]